MTGLGALPPGQPVRDRPARILHLHSSFSLGGKEARATRLMNVMGDRAEHLILSAMPDADGARHAIAPGVRYTISTDADPLPTLHGKPAPGRYVRLARLMQQYDLILSYNWGAMDGVMAHRLLSPFLRLPPLVHHEDGFNADEAERRNTKRNAFRKIALPTARHVIVPSHTLMRIARDEWGVTEPRLRYVANGIDVDAYAVPPQPDAIPGFVRKPGDVIIGTIAGLRTVKNLPALVRAVAPLPSHVKLVIVGEGPERQAIGDTALALGMRDRLTMPGFMREPAKWASLFDIMALSSLSEQQPIAVIEAMAAGLPVVSPAVGDVANMVSTANAPFIGPDLTTSLAALTGDPALRQQVGAANRARASEEFAESTMLRRYNALYGIAGLLLDDA